MILSGLIGTFTEASIPRGSGQIGDDDLSSVFFRVTTTFRGPHPRSSDTATCCRQGPGLVSNPSGAVIRSRTGPLCRKRANHYPPPLVPEHNFQLRMSFAVKDRSAIVTGAGSGINLSFAKLLLEHGCNVLFADLALRPEAQTIVNQYSSKAQTPRAVFQQTDVTDWQQLERMFEVAEQEFGEIDVVCPGAGIFEPHWTNFWRPPGTPESRDARYGGRYALLDINLTHPIRTTQLAIAHFLRSGNKQRRKHIVHISSIAGQNPNFVAPIYVATKHGINGLVRSLAGLDQECGIRITAVAPGVIKTPLWTDHPEKIKIVNEGTDAWVTPDEVAEVMLALIQQDKVSGIIGDRSGRGPQYPVSGGTILEVSKTVRSVEPFNDAGPGDRPGNTVSDNSALINETLGLLSQRGWGMPKL